MSDTQIHTSQMSAADMRLALARIEAEAANVTRENMRPIVEDLLTVHTCASPKADSRSTFVGFYTDYVRMTIDGVQYDVKVCVKDVAASAAIVESRKPAKPLTKAQAAEKALDEKIARLEALTAAAETA